MVAPRIIRVGGLVGDQEADGTGWRSSPYGNSTESHDMLAVDAAVPK